MNLYLKESNDFCSLYVIENVECLVITAGVLLPVSAAALLLSYLPLPLLIPQLLPSTQAQFRSDAGQHH